MSYNSRVCLCNEVYNIIDFVVATVVAFEMNENENSILD